MTVQVAGAVEADEVGQLLADFANRQGLGPIGKVFLLKRQQVVPLLLQTLLKVGL